MEPADRRAWMVAAAVALGAASIGGDAPPERVPEAVLKAVREKYPTGTIARSRVESRRGISLHVLEIAFPSTSTLTATFAAEGKLLEVERPIRPADLPEPAARALAKGFPGMAITQVEEATVGTRVTYLVAFTAKGKPWQAEVTREGKILAAGRGGRPGAYRGGAEARATAGSGRVEATRVAVARSIWARAWRAGPKSGESLKAEA